MTPMVARLGMTLRLSLSGTWRRPSAPSRLAEAPSRLAEAPSRLAEGPSRLAKAGRKPSGQAPMQSSSGRAKVVASESSHPRSASVATAAKVASLARQASMNRNCAPRPERPSGATRRCSATRQTVPPGAASRRVARVASSGRVPMQPPARRGRAPMRPRPARQPSKFRRGVSTPSCAWSCSACSVRLRCASLRRPWVGSPLRFPARRLNEPRWQFPQRAPEQPRAEASPHGRPARRAPIRAARNVSPALESPSPRPIRASLQRARSIGVLRRALLDERDSASGWPAAPPRKTRRPSVSLRPA